MVERVTPAVIGRTPCSGGRRSVIPRGRGRIPPGRSSRGMILAILLALVAAAAASCAARSIPPVRVEDGYLFQLSAPEARAVALAGSFNDWSESSHVLTRESGGIWRIVVPLKKGRYRYMFMETLKNGEKQWRDPPGAASFVPDGFGGRNGIIEVDGE